LILRFFAILGGVKELQITRGDSVVSNSIKKYADNMPNDQTTLTSFLSSLKEELNDHLETINANTTEIQTNYEYLCELDSKIEKLTEKIDEIMLFIGMRKELQVNKNIKLTLREQEVFWVLFLHKSGIGVKELGKRLGLTEYLAKNYIESLASKGIIILKKETAGTVFVCLDPSFRAMQERDSVILVSPSVQQQVC